MPDTPPRGLCYFNGIDGASGEYLVPPLPPDTLASVARGEKWDAEHFRDLQWRRQSGLPNFAVLPGFDPRNLSEVGWGVVFPAGAPPRLTDALREALGELLRLRKGQAGDRYREFAGSDGYQQGESKNQFLARHGARPGPVDPTVMPYYVLLVGDPQSIPFRFQYELDVAYAVGRIYFPRLEDYAHYARSVALAEAPGGLALPRRAAFFGVANPDDAATHLSAEHLVKPLAQHMARSAADGGDWEVRTVFADEARKDRLRQLLGGPETPALLFTAGHGVGFPSGDRRQIPFQGALLCQDWPGPLSWHKEVARDHYLAAEDIDSSARLLGLVAFFFACYGAGTPYWDDFACQAFKSRAAIAPRAFLAALPQRLLAHPHGGALAVVGHVERAWTYSFQWDRAGEETGAFQALLTQLKAGDPVGAALEALNGKYAEIATMLSGELDEAQYRRTDPLELAGLWTANHDARAYAVLGDPAVRLAAVKGGGQPAERPQPEALPARGEPLPEILVPEAAPAPEVAAPTAAPAAAGGGGAPFAPPGLDLHGHIQEALSAALSQFADRVAAFLNGVSNLEVATFVCDDMDRVEYDTKTGRFTAGAQLRALTHIGLDGDIKVCVPPTGAQTDQALWALHTGLVKQAQEARAAMLKAVTDLLAGWPGLRTR